MHRAFSGGFRSVADLSATIEPSTVFGRGVSDAFA